MPILRTIIDKVMTRVLCRDEYESRLLRRYFERTYGIRIGLYTFGAFDRWRIPPNSVIGRYSSVAHTARIIDANHPTDSLSSHPFFYLKDFGIVAADMAKLQAPVIEEDVWLGHNCIIMPGCHRIGRGAVIGAGAVVTRDVPPYAIVVGMPAKVVRYRFPPDIIEGIEATEWWTLDKAELSAALRQAPGLAEAPTHENINQFLHATGRPERPAPKAARKPQAKAVATTPIAASAPPAS
jgi:acetyltransferase-like isoleucine patch superfamily enzyme